MKNIITKQHVKQAQQDADRMLRKVKRLERTSELHKMEEEMKRLKHFDVKSVPKAKYALYDKSSDWELPIGEDTRDEFLAHKAALKAELRERYTKPWAN